MQFSSARLRIFGRVVGILDPAEHHDGLCDVVMSETDRDRKRCHKIGRLLIQWLWGQNRGEGGLYDVFLFTTEMHFFATIDFLPSFLNEGNRIRKYRLSGLHYRVSKINKFD